MIIEELCGKIPGHIHEKRVYREEIPTPGCVKFLTAPGTLSQDEIYILPSEFADTVLPQCKTAVGAVVICVGRIPPETSYLVKLTVISVDCDQFVLHNALVDYLLELQNNTSIAAENLRMKFSSIVEDNYPDGYKAESTCVTFPHPIKSSYCIICIEVEKSHGLAGRNQLMIKRLQEIFPDDNITTYDGDIIVIHSYDGFTHPAQLPTEKLDSLLSEFNAYAGVSNGIRKTSSMRMMYILAKKAIESGKELKRGGHRYFTYDENLIFSIVSMAANTFLAEYNSDDIIAMGSPTLINVMKYDPNNRRDLIETLIQYVISGFSTSRTAENMHLHRNTIQNRISLIEDIMGRKLSENGETAAKLIITYYIIEYYTKVWNKNLVLSPLNPEQDKYFDSSRLKQSEEP